jgi:hypothetical protein
MTMNAKTPRGSERLLEAYAGRDITETSVKQVATLLDGFGGKVNDVQFAGGKEVSGFGFSLTYMDDDVPRCGNDMSKLLELLRKLKHPVRIRDIIINGKPWPDFMRVQFEIGSPIIREQLDLGSIADQVGGRGFGR